jgi:hypothetical protein
MKLINTKNRTERSVCIVLLLVLIAVAASILVRQSYFDIGSYGFVMPGAASSNGSGLTQGGIDLDGLVPGGFKTMLKKEQYNGETLFEKINGKAPLYIDAGFRELSTRRYVSNNDERLWMELFLYDMGTIRNSFSVFSQQRREDARDVSKLGYAYVSSGALFFVKGKYYVEIIGSAKSDVLAIAIMEMGNRIATTVKTGTHDQIAELALFDRDMTIPGSEKFYVKSAFGYGGFTNLYSARYRIGNGMATVFAGKREGRPEAAEMAAGYRKFLLENGATIEKSDASTSMVIVELFGSSEAIAVSGDYIVGVHEAATAADAEKLMENLMKRINARKNER